MLIISVWTYKNRNLKPISLHNTIIVLCKKIDFIGFFFIWVIIAGVCKRYKYHSVVRYSIWSPVPVLMMDDKIIIFIILFNVVWVKKDGVVLVLKTLQLVTLLWHKAKTKRKKKGLERHMPCLATIPVIFPCHKGCQKKTSCWFWGPIVSWTTELN